MPKTLIVIGEFNPAWETHVATNAAIAHSCGFLGCALKTKWCSTAEITDGDIESADGLWVATGAPYRSMDKALEIIRYGREHGVPCLGTCQGFQHIMLEYARTFLGISHPGHAEYGSDLERPFISELSCSLRGTESEIELRKDSLAFESYGASVAKERFYCSYGIGPDYVSAIRDDKSIRISGVDSEGAIRIVEYPEHSFMVGTLFVPQVSSRKGMPHPLVTSFIRAVFAVK